jgi:hypothetical protein
MKKKKFQVIIGASFLATNIEKIETNKLQFMTYHEGLEGD